MPKGDDDSRKGGFGISDAEDKGTGKTKYDKPAKGEDDTATDERRDKQIRGPEPHDEE